MIIQKKHKQMYKSRLSYDQNKLGYQVANFAHFKDERVYINLIRGKGWIFKGVNLNFKGDEREEEEEEEF